MNETEVFKYYFVRIIKYLEIESDKFADEIHNILKLSLSDTKTKSLIYSDHKRKTNLSSFPDDISFIQYIQIDPAFEAVLLYRVCNFWYKLYGDSYALRIIATYAKARSSCAIYFSANIGPGFCIFHGNGVVIGPNHKIGNNFTVHQGVTLGQQGINQQTSMKIEDNVTVYCNSVLIGSIDICSDVIIGANSLVNRSIDTAGVWFGSPAKFHKNQ